MKVDDGLRDICWSPRLRKDKLRRLYEQDAVGICDGDLLEEVGWCLYMRCRDILAIQSAQYEHQVRCPRCARARGGSACGPSLGCTRSTRAKAMTHPNWPSSPCVKSVEKLLAMRT